MRKLALILGGILAGVALLTAPVGAASTIQDSVQDACSLENASGVVGGCESGGATLDTVLTNLVNVALTVIGIVAVVVIVMGGQRYITSGGDPAKAKAAKDMIMYAVIGLVVAVLAWAIVGFVARSLAGGGSSGGSGGGSGGSGGSSQQSGSDSDTDEDNSSESNSESSSGGTSVVMEVWPA